MKSTGSSRYFSFTFGFVVALLVGLSQAFLSAQAPLTSASAGLGYHRWAALPPMGWNSWDCFGAGVTELETLQNAEYMQTNLKKHGWKLITVDIQWYEPLAHTDQYRKGAVLEMDANGRLLPAPNRFPSTKETRSFKPLADVLPLGNIRTWRENNSWTHFTHDEQITLMTLWTISRSPLIVGAHLPKNDAFTLSLLTNDEIIAVDQHSTNNKQVSNQHNHIVWTADVPDSKDKYLAIFNAVPAPAPRGRGRGAPDEAAPAPAPPNPTDSQPAAISISLAEIGMSGRVAVRDLWTHKDLGIFAEKISATVNSHGAVAYRLKPVR